jgi:hypothetical protein
MASLAQQPHTRGYFRKELLPPPSSFWKYELGRMSRPNRNWTRSKCPLHGGNNPTAFSANLATGGFHCFNCGAHGGDLVDYVMQRDGIDFKAAARSLGALAITGDSADFQTKLAARQQQRKRINRAADNLAQFERALRIECRERIHESDRVLHAPAPWSEAQWQRAKAASALRDEFLLPAYTLLSFGAVAERARYVLADWQVRAEMAAAVRIAGGVRTDSGHWMGVVA